MSYQEINTALLKLTGGMLYISESDYELNVLDWGAINKAATAKKISETAKTDEITEKDAATFFKKTIDALDPGDDLAAGLAKQYKELFAYLQATFKEISVFRAGDTQVHIFIVCYMADGYCFAIHTISVET